MTIRRSWLKAGMVLGVLAAPVTGLAEEPPLLVIYGSEAPTREGDEDHREVIFFSLPAGAEEPLYLRLFDPETGGRHDLVYGAADGSTRFRLFGGEGAFSLQPASAAGADTAGVDPSGGGQLLAEQTFGADDQQDDRWLTIASFLSGQGERIGERVYFRLVVEGQGGNDGNLFTPAVSLRERRNLAPEGLRLFGFAPTVRMPDREARVELRFRAPDEVQPIRVENFDAANGRLALATRFRSLPLAASGQDSWRESEVSLRADERGQPAAIQFEGGDEIPNDATFRLFDGAGQPLPVDLPPRRFSPNRRPLPVADVTLLADCSSVAFDGARSTDRDGDSLSFAWQFGDGASGAGASVVHRYRPGRYRALLQVTDGSAEIGKGAEREFDVLVPAPPSAAAGADRVVAVGERVAFDGSASAAGDRPIARYQWDFGDGGRGSGPTPGHRFERPERYLVTLRVEDDAAHGCNAGRDELEVVVNAAPVAVAGKDLLVAAGEQVVLDGSQSYDRDGRITAFRWQLGDGRTADGAKVEHRYDRPGRYRVALTVEDDAGVANSRAADSLHVVVNHPPVATAGPDIKAAAGEVLTFDGSASSDADGRIVAHEWDFGDGRRATGERVTYAYTEPGRYRVTLGVRDDSGTRSDRGADALEVLVNAPPVAEAGPDQRLTASVVRFDGSGSHDPDGRIVAYEWDFGDGRSGSGAAPEHVYERPGIYQVRLTVVDDSGTRRNTAGDALQVVINAAPIADAGPDMILAPGEAAVFNAGRSLDPDGDLAVYEWDFRDGGRASGARVSHAFAEPGIYQVRLTVRDDSGEALALATDDVRVVVNAQPVADAGPDLLAAPGEEVVFDGRSSFDLDGRLVGYRWDFGDGEGPLEGAEARRSFERPGIYRVLLTVSDDSGAANGTAQSAATLRINGRPQAVAGEDVFGAGSTLDFDGSASVDPDGDSLTYRWTFGDGSEPAIGARVRHSFPGGGTYPVVLEVDDSTGLANSKARSALTAVIDRPPVADAGGSREVCAGDVVVFDGTGSSDPDGGLLRYHWDFGDGSSDDSVNPTKTYEAGKVYPVTLTVRDESGLPGGVHSDRIAVSVQESPIAEAGPDQTVCAGSEVRFDGSGSSDFDGVVNRFLWNFGDGREGGGERPVHVYEQPGSYRVALTIWGDEGGRCDSSHTDDLTVLVQPAPAVAIAAPAAAAAGSPVTFDASGSFSLANAADAPMTTAEINDGTPPVDSTGDRLRWDFGDGQDGQGQVAEHVFAEPGTYVVTLTRQSGDAGAACASASARHVIRVNAAPLAVVGGERRAAPGEELLFDAGASSDPDGAIARYHWDFGDGEAASGVQARHRFAAPGSYVVTLTVDDGAGLANSLSTVTTRVLVNAAPEPRIEAPEVACSGESVTFDAAGSSDPDGKIAGYAWNFGDLGSSDGNIEEASASRVFERPGHYDIGLTVDDGSGRANGSAKTAFRLHVNQPPVAAAGPDLLTCPGSELSFDAGASSDADGSIERWVWDFGDGATAEGRTVRHRYTEPGDYRVRLQVRDDSGSNCASAVDTARVTVNSRPIAKASGDRTGWVGGAHDRVALDAGGSSDPDGGPLSYVWDLGDGLSATGETIRHGYLQPGSYTVRLSAMDGSGLPCGTGTDELGLELRPRPR